MKSASPSPEIVLPLGTAVLSMAALCCAVIAVIGEDPVKSVLAAAFAAAASGLSAFAAVRTVRQRRRRTETMREHQAQARVLSHESRTPLAIIQGSAELLLDARAALNPEQRGFLDAIVSNSRILRRLVEDLLTQARIDAGLFSIHRETVDYRELMATVVRELRPLYPVKILLGNLRAPLLVSLDPVLLRQVMNNLISNCARHSADSHVLVRIIGQENGVLTVVSDFGPGIEEAPARLRHPDSNGIGLRVVRTIMQIHGGALYLDSTPGHGTTASIYLPALTDGEGT